MACESIYWTNIHDYIEKHIKITLHVMIFRNKRKDNTPCYPSQTMGDSWYRYVHLTQWKLPLYCRLSQQVPCHQEDGRLISRQLNTNMKIIYFRIQFTNENDVRFRW